MRELQLWDQSHSLQAGFQDIEQLAEQCRFRDCSHRSEPGCAVVGQVDEQRLASYFKLLKELRYMEQKTDMAAKLAEKRKWKQVSKQIKKR